MCPNSSPTHLVGWRPHPSIDISLVVHVTALQSAQFYKCAGEMKGIGNSDCRASSEELLTSSSQGQRGRGRRSEGGVQEGEEEGWEAWKREEERSEEGGKTGRGQGEVRESSDMGGGTMET